MAFDIFLAILREKWGRAGEARAYHVAALGFLAFGPLTLDVGGVVDQSETVGALSGVAVWVFGGYTWSARALI